jgi:hypothetical protein
MSLRPRTVFLGLRIVLSAASFWLHSAPSLSSTRQALPLFAAESDSSDVLRCLEVSLRTHEIIP